MRLTQIEEWTGMKIGNIIFDSDIDNWKQGSSVFDQKILKKSNLLFLIEEEKNKLFCGYINAIVDKCDEWVNNPKSFLFSLKSNGRLNGKMKFGFENSQYALYL